MRSRRFFSFLFFIIPAVAFAMFALSQGWQWSLAFREQQQLFLYDWDYVREILLRTGGLSVLTARFLVQFFHNPVAALVITSALIGLVSFLSSKVISIYTDNKLLLLLSVVPAAVITVFISDKNFHFEVLTAVILSLIVIVALKGRKKIALFLILPVYLAIWPFADRHFYYEENADEAFDRFYKYEMLASDGNWDRIAEESGKHLPKVFDAQYYHLAQANRGMLADELFNHPQAGPLGLINMSQDHSADLKLARILFSAGNYAGAQNIAFNSLLSQYGYNPSMLQILAEVEQLRGSDLLADKYLSILEKSLRYRGWAKMKRTDPAVGTFPDKDSFVLFKSPMDDFFDILDADSSNTVAMQYGLSYLLLAKDINNTFSFINRYYGTPALTELPVAAQEALVFFSEYYANMDEPFLESQGLSQEQIVSYKAVDAQWCREHGVTQATFDRFEAFKKADARHDGGGLAGYYDTFWYYLLYKKI